MTNIWEVVANGIVSPEGPAAGPNDNVFLVSRWTGKVVKVDEAGDATTVVQTGGKPQAVAIQPNGELLLADAKNRALQKITPAGALTTVCDRVLGQRLLGPNDLLIGPDNIVYLTDPGDEMDEPGQVLRVDLVDGQASVLVEGLMFPNGIALSDDATYLYIAESTRHRVWQYPLVEEGRKLGQGAIFHQFDDFYPDGMAFDSAGNLLVALHGGGVLAVLSPAGEKIDSIPVGGKGCTNCVFGGDDFQDLYLTEDDQQALLKTRWPRPGQRRYSRSLS